MHSTAHTYTHTHTHRLQYTIFYNNAKAPPSSVLRLCCPAPELLYCSEDTMEMGGIISPRLLSKAAAPCTAARCLVDSSAGRGVASSTAEAALSVYLRKVDRRSEAVEEAVEVAAAAAAEEAAAALLALVAAACC
jgi:hypothetical protein